MQITEYVNLPGGWFHMGANDGPHLEDGEGPVRRVWVDEFKVSSLAISNKKFQEFVIETKYKTLAEELGSSFVFFKFLENHDRYPISSLSPIWRSVPGANWAAPEGFETTLINRWNHPVVHISLRDALAFCQWNGSRLLSEAEWEYTARGKMNCKNFPWGNDLAPNDELRANIWKGEFPNKKHKPEKKFGTVAIDSFDPNGFGIFNMIGNVWELVNDRFTNLHSPRDQRNPQGPLNGDRIVAKGGSYLCHNSYCSRYRNSSRQSVAIDTTSGNIGFRVAFD